ncbi:hypothetical protein PYO71_14080, partial [Staphylococcus aureus]|nr:hypothetical protein [Staphylococcus aureus]
VLWANKTRLIPDPSIENLSYFSESLRLLNLRKLEHIARCAGSAPHAHLDFLWCGEIIDIGWIHGAGSLRAGIRSHLKKSHAKQAGALRN